MLKIIGLFIFLAFASVALSILFRLTAFQDHAAEDPTDRRRILWKIIRRSFMLK